MSNWGFVAAPFIKRGLLNTFAVPHKSFTPGFFLPLGKTVGNFYKIFFAFGRSCAFGADVPVVPAVVRGADFGDKPKGRIGFVFGNFFLELQDQGLEEEAQILPGMKRIHEETDIPFVATNDVHYVNRDDAGYHDVLLCIQTAANIDEEDRMRFPNDQFYLKSEDEMRKIFAGIPEACDNTEIIAQRCNVEFEFGKLHLPEFTAPDGMTNNDYLRKLCEKGIKERYSSEAGTLKAVKGDIYRGVTEVSETELRQRLEYELSTIEEMGYVEYFLIVWDFINYAKQQGIMVGPGRGSAAGSIVAYTLRITDIDPIKYNLIFERFLNPERVSMPDIDVDFCYERRGEVIDYVVEKYGEDKVSQIITFGTMKAKAAVRDVGRALNVSYQETDAIAKAIPFALNTTIDIALNTNPDLRKMYEEDMAVKRVLDTAKAIEGMPRHASTHAAGVVISKEAIDEYVPLYLAEKGVATQFPMTTVEELGLLKMDFLGLRTLTVIRDAVNLIKKNHLFLSGSWPFSQGPRLFFQGPRLLWRLWPPPFWFPFRRPRSPAWPGPSSGRARPPRPRAERSVLRRTSSADPGARGGQGDGDDEGDLELRVQDDGVEERFEGRYVDGGPAHDPQDQGLLNGPFRHLGGNGLRIHEA